MRDPNEDAAEERNMTHCLRRCHASPDIREHHTYENVGYWADSAGRCRHVRAVTVAMHKCVITTTTANDVVFTTGV